MMEYFGYFLAFSSACNFVMGWINNNTTNVFAGVAAGLGAIYLLN